MAAERVFSDQWGDWKRSCYCGEPRAGGGAAMVLQTSQMPHVIARRGPQLPGRDAAAVPRRIAVGMRVAPQIAVPAEPEHRLPTYAAIARASGMGLFAKRGRRRAKAEQHPRRFPVAAPPHPAFRRAAQRRERAGELVGADRMLPPIGFDGAPRGRRDERAGERVPQHGRRKDRRQIAPQARQRLGVSLRAPGGRGHRSSDLGWAVVATILPAKRCRFVAGDAAGAIAMRSPPLWRSRLPRRPRSIRRRG